MKRLRILNTSRYPSEPADLNGYFQFKGFNDEGEALLLNLETACYYRVGYKVINDACLLIKEGDCLEINFVKEIKSGTKKIYLFNIFEVSFDDEQELEQLPE